MSGRPTANSGAHCRRTRESRSLKRCGASGPPSLANPLSDFEELLALLNVHHVRALIVGGYALAFHGHPRYTKDLDLLIDASADNAQALLKALDEFGFGGVGLTPSDFSPGRVVQLGVAPNRVDLMANIDGVSFDEAWAGRVAGQFRSVPVLYLGREAFITNKKAAGRPQDLADVDALE